MRCCVVTVALLLLAGCVVLETGPVSTDERPAERCESDVRIGRLDRVWKRVRPENGRAALTLEVAGDIDVGYEQRVEVVESVRGRTGVGLFPWTFADRPGEKPGVDYFKAILVNYGLALTPTLYSLFFEPFSDYPSSGVNDHVFAGFSILGAYRYCAEPVVKRRYSRVDRSRVSKGVYRIEDFTIDYGGRSYRAMQGRVVLPVAYEVGMTVEAKILSADVTSEELRYAVLSPEWQAKSWEAGGKRQSSSGQNPVSVKPAPSGARTVSKDQLVGMWESYQSHRMVTTMEAQGKSIEKNQTMHYTYEFFSDGTCRQTSELSGKETLWSGQWQIVNGSLRLEMKNQDGSVCRMDYLMTPLSSDEIGCRFADLDAYARLHIKGAIKSATAHYDESGDLVLTMGLETKLKNGRTSSTTMVSRFSPLVLERQEGK